jgi:hypothetical protein
MGPALRFILLLAIGAALSAGGGQPAWAAGADGGEQRREAVADSGRLRFDLPDGLCRVEPQRGGNHAKLWQSFTPPPQRNARLLALDIDCATLLQAEAGRLVRPRRLFQLVDSPPDPRLPNSLEGALIALEERFSQPELAARAPVLGRDAYAVYVEQGKADKGSLSGVSAFTLKQSQPLILNLVHFDGSAQVPEIRARLAETVRSLHDLSP